MSNNRGYRRGAVSIFVVIFTALLITVVAVSFVRLMLRDQQRATNSDLSQSAYDAALAGVEDAKRALTKYRTLSSSAQAAYNLQECATVPSLIDPHLDPVATDGVPVGNSAIQQAYTCVTVDLTPVDYLGQARADQLQLIPLRGTGTANRVVIEWFSKTDASGNNVNLTSGTKSNLSRNTNWSATTPPVLETQIIQTSSSFTLRDFDPDASGGVNTNTLLLYPKNLIAVPSLSFASSTRLNSGNSPTDVQCKSNIESIDYSCKATIQLPNPVGGSAVSRENTYLRITPRYNATEYRITMLASNGKNVRFDGAQAEVDSTGRANDLFRRVSARIEGVNSVPYPEAAVDVRGNFCKVFIVADTVARYDSQSSLCKP